MPNRSPRRGAAIDLYPWRKAMGSGGNKARAPEGRNLIAIIFDVSPLSGWA